VEAVTRFYCDTRYSDAGVKGFARPVCWRIGIQLELQRKGGSSIYMVALQEWSHYDIDSSSFGRSASKHCFSSVCTGRTHQLSPLLHVFTESAQITCSNNLLSVCINASNTTILKTPIAPRFPYWNWSLSIHPFTTRYIISRDYGPQHDDLRGFSSDDRRI
jgi:hypothetical protein